MRELAVVACMRCGMLTSKGPVSAYGNWMRTPAPAQIICDTLFGAVVTHQTPLRSNPMLNEACNMNASVTARLVTVGLLPRGPVQERVAHQIRRPKPVTGAGRDLRSDED